MRHTVRIVLAVAASVRLFAQSPAFEVASIKETAPRSDGSFPIGMGPRPGGRWIAQGATLLTILRSAYPDFRMPGQIAGVPKWAETTRYDVNAAAGSDATPEQMTAMVRQLVTDRFRLMARVERRDLDVYALVVARSDGQLGPRLKRSTLDCRQAAPSPPPSSGEPLRCGAWQLISGGGQRVLVGGGGLGPVASALQTVIGRPVVDRTGLTGSFDVDLEFDRQITFQATQGGPPSPFTAVQEQLGLRLEERKERMDVLVIDHAEMPTPD